MTSMLANAKKFISLILFILLLSGAAFAGGTIQWPTACFFDSNGDPLSGGLLNSYAAGTSTRKALYSDREATTAHTNPEVLDANGCTEVYGIGTYKLVLKDSADSTTYFTDDNVTVTGTGSNYIVMPEDYGTVDGTADEVQINLAIQALTRGTVSLNGSYTIAAPIVPKSNVNLKGKGKITLANGSDCFMVSLSTAMSNISIEGLEFDGNGDNQSGSDTSIIHSSAGNSEIIIKNNTFRDSLYDGFHHHEDTSDTAITGLQIINNRFYGSYKGGINVYDGRDVVISGNIIDNTDNTPTSDSNGIGLHACINAVVTDNVIKLSSSSSSDSTGIGGGTAVASAGNDSYNVVIRGNTIDGNDGVYNNGITVPGVSGTVAYNYTISDNTIIGCMNDSGLGSIELATNVERCVINNNIIENTVRGIAINKGGGTLKYITISNNIIKDYGKSAISITATRDIIISNNQIYNGTGGNSYAGIFINSPVAKIVCSKNIIDTSNSRGFFIDGTTADTIDLVISNNVVRDTTQDIFFYNANISEVVLTGNIFRGGTSLVGPYTGTNGYMIGNIGYLGGGYINTFPASNTPWIRAGSGNGTYLTESARTLTNIGNAEPGAILHIIAAHVTTISDNANFRIAGGDGAGGADYVMAVGDTLTLIYDGSLWVELARSVN